MKSSFPTALRVRRVRGATGALVTALACWIGATAAAQEASRNAIIAHRDEKALSEIIDSANMFDTGAIAAAREELRRIEREAKLATIIETIDTLEGTTLVDETTRRAERSGIHGIFILIAKKEKSLELLVSRKDFGVLPTPRQKIIRAAFIDGFRQRNFDQGLKQGVAAIAEGVAAAHGAGEPATAKAMAFLPGPDASTASSAGVARGLVVRNQVRLTLAGARTLIAGAEVKARSLRLNVNIAVVDDGGHLLAFERMDGARPASGYTAITKATSAATFRQPTGPLPAGATDPDALLNLSLQIAAASSGGKITTLYGGVPVVVDGQVIGAVGVGGGTGEQDAQVARAGIQVFVEQLAVPRAVEKDENTLESKP